MEKREGARNDSTRLVSMTHFSTLPLNEMSCVLILIPDS
jgi:hypothetical protein